MARARSRVVTIGGIPRRLSAARARQLEVVRGVLVGAITVEQGARRLRVARAELARLVEGARRAVIAALGEDALAAARHAEYSRADAR